MRRASGVAGLARRTLVRGGLLLGLVGGGYEARAQRELGACIGLNLATQRYQQQGQRVREKKAGLPHFGLTTSFGLGPNLAVQPELLLTQVGTKHSQLHQYAYHVKGEHIDFLQYLMLSVAMVGRIPIGTSGHGYAVVGGGPYGAVVTFAEATHKVDDSLTDDLEIGEDKTDDYRRFDAGMSLRAAYEYKPGDRLAGLTFFTGLTLTYGMRNVQPGGDEQNSRYNRCLGLTTGLRVKI